MGLSKHKLNAARMTPGELNREEAERKMTPLRRHVIIGAIALGVLGTTLTTAGCGTRARAQTHPVSALATTITIDPNAGETFAPAPAGAKPALTAQAAWNRYTQVDTAFRGRGIAHNVSVRLGLLTLAIGPTGPNGSETYTAHNELVYGYSWHQCPVSRNPNVKKLPPNPCRAWLFLDASTGRQIDETFQI